MTVLSKELYQVAESGDAEGLRDRLRYAALTNLYYFTKVVLGYRELSPRLHQEFCEYIVATRTQRRRGGLIPRGHFKSTIVSKSYPLWRLIPIDLILLNLYPDLLSWIPLHNRNFRVVIVGESHEVAAKNIKDIKWNICNNQILQWLFPEIIPLDIPNPSSTWRDDEILLPRDKSFDESSITTLGVGAKTTGKHWDIIVYDDLIGEKAAKSEAEMEAAKHWFTFAPGLANDPNTVEELFIGTRWKAGTADLYGWVMATLPSEEADVQSASPLHTDGSRAGGFTWYVRSAIEPNPDTGEPEPIFPERFSLPTLEAIRRREGEYAFSCNYLNNPVAAGMTDFDIAWLKEYQVGEDAKTLFPMDKSPAILLGYLNRISFYDPSSGGRSAKCEAAIVAVGTDSRQRRFILEEWSDNTTFGKAACKWMTLNDKFYFYKNYYEAVGAQKSIVDVVGLLNHLLRSGKPCPHCGSAHRPLRVEAFSPPGGSAEKSKDDRIRTFLQQPVESGRVYVRFNSHRKFRTQLSEFPHGPLKDVLDAAAYAVHLCAIPQSEEELAEERERQELRRATSRPRTHTAYDYGGY